MTSPRPVPRSSMRSDDTRRRVMYLPPLSAALGVALLSGCLSGSPHQAGGAAPLPKPSATASGAGVSPRPTSSAPGTGVSPKPAPSGSASPTASTTGTPAPSASPGKPLPATESAPAPQQPARLPVDLLDLAPWKLTLPTDRDGTDDDEAAEVTQPNLDRFALAPYFTVSRGGDGVVFRAPVEGTTTGGSSYPRSELREMTPAGDKASWSSTTGVHTMEIRQAITHLPVEKPHVVAGQIHDASDDIVMIRLEGASLFVEHDGDSIGDLDTDYRLGDVFTVKLVAADGRIKVYYNDQIKVDIALKGSGLYFKAGCYTQSNTSKGDKPGAYGEVTVYDLHVSHQ